MSLLHLEPEEGNEKAPKVPESVIRAALLRRAVEDIHRIIQIRTAKQACSTLLQRGSVGDDLWQRFLRAEQEMEAELRDVVMEVGKFALASCFLADTFEGKRTSGKLGYDNIPVRQRNCCQHNIPEAT